MTVCSSKADLMSWRSGARSALPLTLQAPGFLNPTPLHLFGGALFRALLLLPHPFLGGRSRTTYVTLFPGLLTAQACPNAGCFLLSSVNKQKKKTVLVLTLPHLQATPFLSQRWHTTPVTSTWFTSWTHALPLLKVPLYHLQQRALTLGQGLGIACLSIKR